MAKQREMTDGVLSLRQALRWARELGLDVRDNRGTGEVRVRFDGGGRVNHNARRKDASRALMHLLRQADAAARKRTVPTAAQ